LEIYESTDAVGHVEVREYGNTNANEPFEGLRFYSLHEKNKGLVSLPPFYG